MTNPVASIVEHSLALPKIEDRRSSVFFKFVCPIFGMDVDNDFHWILYSTYRNSFLVSLVFAFIMGAQLFFSDETIEKEFISTQLKIFSLSTSIPLLFFIAPFSITRALKLIGFSKIDYANAFKPKADIPNLDRKAVLKYTRMIFFVSVLSVVFGYFAIGFILGILNLSLSPIAVLTVTIIFSLVGIAFMMMLLVLSIMGYLQYRYHFEKTK